MAEKSKILIIDDEAPIRDVLSAALNDEGYQVEVAADGEAGLAAIRNYNPEIVFLDIWMPGKYDGIEVLTLARKEFPLVDFVMISGHGTIETAVKATKLGAWDFIEKPLSMDKILIVISNIISYQQQKSEKTLLLNKLRKSIALIGETPAIVATKQIIARVAPTNSWILVQGEPGCGKQLAAQNIHYMSPRASKTFVDINAGSIPEELQEAELFGIAAGTMPGVDKDRSGKIDLANGGTLYIADIGSLTLSVQAKLLKYLETGKYTRAGGVEMVSSDVRIITSTPRDLEQEVKSGLFREDFYYRLNVIPFKVPSLREHREDIPVLSSYFADNIVRESGFSKKAISEKAMEKMMNHIWPGNVRELKNFIERLYILTPGDYVDVHDVRFAGLIDKDDERAVEMKDLSTFREARAEFEKEYLVRKINENSGNISRTAEVIGLERSYLHRKIKAYGIDHKE